MATAVVASLAGDLSATTAADGVFVLHVEPRSAPSRDAAAVLVVLPGHARVVAHAERVDGARAAFGDIILSPEAVIRGSVISEAGHPVAGAEITVIEAQPESLFPPPWLNPEAGRGLSGEDGHFEVRGVRAHSIVTVARSVHHAPGWSRAFEAQAGEVTDVGAIVLAAGEQLDGRVLDETGAGVAGARVRAVRWLTERSASEGACQDAIFADLYIADRLAFPEGLPTLTDAEGVFSLGGLPFEPHVLLVDAPGFEPVRVEAQVPGVDRPIVALRKTGLIELSVRSAGSGRPLPDAAVHATNFASSTIASYSWSTPLDVGHEAGVFTLLRPSRCLSEVIVEARGHATTRVELAGLEPGETAAYEVVLEPEARLLGRAVRAATGAAVQGARIECLMDGMREPFVTLADESGRFLFTRLPAGAASLDVAGVGLLPIRQQLTLSAGEGHDLGLLRLSAGGSIEGRIVGGGGDGRVGGLTIRGRFEDGDQRETAITDDDGAFAFRALAPGTWSILGPSSSDVLVEEGRTARVTLNLPVRARLHGQVVGVGMRSVAADVLAWRAPLFDRMVPSARTVTDSNGEWFLEVHEGSYHVRAVEAVGAEGGAGFSRLIRIDAATGSEQRLVLELGLGSVRGGAFDATTGQPVAGLSIHATPLGETILFGTAWPKTDETGAFAFTHIPLGEYTLTARAEDYATVELEVTAGGGAAAPVRFDLERVSRLAGTIQLRRGGFLGEGAEVVLEPLETGRRVHSAYVYGEGHFRIDRVHAGSYRLEVFSFAGDLLHQDVVDLRSGEPSDIEITVALRE